MGAALRLLCSHGHSSPSGSLAERLSVCLHTGEGQKFQAGLLACSDLPQEKHFMV